jgi:hypothetical protein
MEISLQAIPYGVAVDTIPAQSMFMVAAVLVPFHAMMPMP